ncbi:hypothetical protein KR222_011363, partial [Zaprionus bogoriensis]
RKKSVMEAPSVPAPPSSHDSYLDQTQNLVHPHWELVDPTPDIFAMFVRFDEKFFQRRLGAVTVEWSKRMYSCAGICYQRGNRYIKEVIIRLSEPLLKLRPRKDLVETLLHEMIHAYCFVLNIREGNGGHGPNFKRIMETINKVAGTNITVYHTFHDEVNMYKTHIWRCNGVCQFHNPFQGWVKRTSNRAPGPSDQWWEKHQRDCGGTFEKVSEPAKPAKPAAKTKAIVATKPTAKLKKSTSDEDIRNFFEKPKAVPKKVPTIKSDPASATGASVAAAIGGLASAFPPTSYPGVSSNPMAGLKRSNVVGFKDLGSSDEGTRDSKDTPQSREMQGQGYNLLNGSRSGSGSASTNSSRQSADVDRQHLRDLWSKRFAGDKKETEAVKPKPEKKLQQPIKRRRVSTDLVNWESYDDDVMIADVEVAIIQISDSEDEATEQAQPHQPNQRQKQPPAAPPMSSQERTLNIKREVMEEESMYSDDDIFMIDDEYDDGATDDTSELSAAIELADQSIIDDLFGEDTLLQEFQRENDVVPCSSRYQHDAANDITECPICFEKMKRSDFANHLEGCRIVIRVVPPSQGRAIHGSTKSTSSGKRKAEGGGSKRSILKQCGYTDAEIAAIDLSSSGESPNSSLEESQTPRQVRQSMLHRQTVQCPKCGQNLLGHQLEAHRKLCKRKKKG